MAPMVKSSATADVEPGPLLLLGPFAVRAQDPDVSVQHVSEPASAAEEAE